MITIESVAESLSIRVMEGDHLVAAAIERYATCRTDDEVQAIAEREARREAQQGAYLKALIHNEIFRLHGGED